MKMIDFNLNEDVYVKLTDTGRRMHRADYESLPEYVRVKMLYAPPQEDDDGWSEWSMWELMHLFGGAIYMGVKEPPFNLNIRLKVE